MPNISCPESDITLNWVASEVRLSRAQCNEIEHVAKLWPQRKPETISGGTNQMHRLGYSHKFINDDRTEWIFKLLSGVAFHTNSDQFKLSLKEMHPRPEYVEYVPGNGKFDWHSD